MNFNYFLPKSYPQFVALCQHIFTIGEPGIIHFIPKTDCEVRINQLIQDYSFKLRLSKIQLTSQIVNEVGDVESFVRAAIGKKKNESVGVFIIRSEMAIMENSVSFLDKLLALQNSNSSYHFIFVTEMDFTCQPVAKQFASQTSIFSNVNYYPLYGKEDSVLFLDHLCKEWKYEVEKLKKEHILKECGGHSWLLKEALRRVMVDPQMSVDEICNSETMRFRIEQIYFSFLKSEQEVLKKIVKKERKYSHRDEMHSLGYLKKMKLIENNEITIPLLTKYIKGLIPKVNLKLSDNHILVNELVLDTHFSRKEQKVLRTLMKNPVEIITRDMLAKVVWPINTDSYYTEWALDRIIARLRSKLLQLGISKDLIVTLRGKGYMMRNE